MGILVDIIEIIIKVGGWIKKYLIKIISSEKLRYKIWSTEKRLKRSIDSKDNGAIFDQIKLLEKDLVEAADAKDITKIKRILNILLSHLDKINDIAYADISLAIVTLLINLPDDSKIIKTSLGIIFHWFAKYETNNMDDFKKYNLRCEYIFLRSCLLIVGKYSNDKEKFRVKVQEFGEYLFYHYQYEINPLIECKLDIQYISVLWQIAAKAYLLEIHPIDEHLINLIKLKTTKNEEGYNEALKGYIPLIPSYYWPPDFQVWDPYFTKFPLSNREEIQKLSTHIWPRII